MFMMGCKGVYFTLCLLTLRVTGQGSTVDASIRTKSFFKNVNPLYTNTNNDNSSLVNNKPSSKRHSYMGCATKCLAALPNCTSYLHNTSTGLCVLAPSPVPLVPQFVSGEGDLYVSCDSDNGFHMQRYGTATACIALEMKARANFTDACSHCEEIGGFLTSVKTLDKLHLLTSAIGGNASFWVGLDDMEEEGAFVWQEDGQVAFRVNESHTAATMAELMMPGLWDSPREPNNFMDNEDCIQVKYSTTLSELRLNDFRCNTNNRFICEMPVRFT